MDSDYDKKFEEMKKYIPFLESMIKRLESTNASSTNPRQAQLDKIRSLRDLLLNKKKRMKMENLLKCEQVLVNLYAKVEQRDTLSTKKVSDPGFAIDPPTLQEKSDLEAVRNRFKTVVKRQEEIEETLPEILRGNEVEEVHTAGSKEPALFQRRPNKPSISPTHHTPTKTNEDKASSQSSASKRNYTRVLVSPETNKRRWSPTATPEEKPLFSRRSPRRSPRRYSPSYHKRERKKSTKDSRKSRDLNITLNVPEDSLGTLNTKDLVSRIITCSDGDVDIDTLRGLRKQILTELQKTGAKDDISDLLLKSYNKKKKPKTKKKEEVEEGELSDSESEVIENIYGNITTNLVFKDKNETKTSSDKEKEHKIQICLTINSDKDKSNSNTSKNIELPDTPDVLELEMYDKNNKEDIKSNTNKDNKTSEVINIDDEDTKISKKDINAEDSIDEKTKEDVNVSNPEPQKLPAEEKEVATKPGEPIQFKANFYKPLSDNSDSIESNKLEVSKDDIRIEKEADSKTDVIVKPSTSIEAELEKMENTTEIPLLNEPTMPAKPTKITVSEIDILQALKNEILSETITIPKSEVGTPLLHQPKIMKVASAQEILPKKRISIEKYKQKTVKSSKLLLDEDVSSKDDQIKKTSLKLTEKECERFNIPKISFDDDSSDGDNESEIQVSDIYGDLAPKSPDHEESSNNESLPVIIPVDPVKTLPVNHKADIDMRTLPILSPNKNTAPTFFNNTAVPSNNEISVDKKKVDQSQSRPPLFDPRVRRELNLKNSNQSTSPHSINPDRTPNPMFSMSQSPATNSAMTPNARSYEMTPSHQSFEIDHSKNNHVYVPSFSLLDTRERETSVTKETRWEKGDPLGERKSRYDDLCDASWSSSDVSQNTRYNDSFTGDKNNKGQRIDRYSLDTRESYPHQRLECPKTPVPSFGRSEASVTTNHTIGRLDMPMTPLHLIGRADCPTTPHHPLGRSECPPTPSHSFGRSECPPTPTQSFGRSECPPTPSHSFGRSECPLTPSHSFGRSECPPTPSHSFGRSECPPTPSHSFGRLDCPPAPNYHLGSHSFNINDCPLTPGHSFGASECPPMPTSLFGRNECPPTPNHQYGLLEGPQTPNPSFGRSDSTPNLFGRSDYNIHKYTKDPRLNRKSEYDSNSPFDERDRGYYKDRGYYRGNSYKSQKTFSGSDTYQVQDREHGRNSKYRYYAQDQSGRQFNKDQSRREQNVGSSKDYKNDRQFIRDCGRFNSDTRSYEEVGLRRGNQRERSAGRNVLPTDQREKSVGRNVRPDHTRSSSRARSVGRNSSMEPEHNILSVKPHAGRSFVIDTSVNATFQSFLESGKGIQVFEYNNDDRRKRAASVGRSLVRESSVGRVISRGRTPKTEIENKREVFRRASSMGRDMAHSAIEKRSFQEIKADFETYRHAAKEIKAFDICKIRNIDTKSKNTIDHTDRNRKQVFEKRKEEYLPQNTTKAAYSPRKNYRDPRMRKEYDNKNKHYDKYGEPRARKSGIVYSNDNIVKGAILASGYGVKNYKIPKIKRPIEEKEMPPKKDEKQAANKKDVNDKRNNTEKVKEQETTKEKVYDKNKDKIKETPKQKSKEVSKEKKETTNEESPKRKIKEVIRDKEESDIETKIQMEDISKSDEHVERRLTRSSRRILEESTERELVTKTKRSKKPIIDDSDSDADDKPNVKASDMKTKIPEHTSPVKEKNVSTNPSAVGIDTNFNLEEIEMFSDSVVSDPVLDNITALIADLDNDLDTSKSESRNDFTKEITLENMMQNITCPQLDNSSQSGEEFSEVLQAVDNLSRMSDEKMDDTPVSDLNNVKEINDNVSLSNTEISQDSNVEDSSTEKSNVSQIFDNLLCTKKSRENVSIQNDTVEHKHDDNLNADTSFNGGKHANEDIVSTSETEKDTISIEDKSKIDEQNVDGCSTPDSTINTDDVIEKPKIDDGLADSTNEIHSETNVTSTDSIEPKPSSSHTETTPALELGNFLTILQDKTKIKELLSMLGVQSGDNDKIKKKLEKLSEIVSDDETDERAEQHEDSKIEPTDNTDGKSVDVNTTVDEKTEITEETEEQLHKYSQDTEKVVSAKDIKSEEKAEQNETDLQKIEDKYKKPVKKPKFTRKAKGRFAKKVASIAEKRVTRATAAVEPKQKPKKPTRELQKLHEDIKEMFIREDILSATGIRMCRLAKLVDEKTATKEEAPLPDAEPVVVLEKFKNANDRSRDQPFPEKVRKKPGPKPKSKISTDSFPEMEKEEKLFKYKPGPKSKTKIKRDSDPYVFETDSVGDTTTEKASEDDSNNSSDSEICSLASSKSFGSTEFLSDIKKKTKRRRRGWQDGVIKPKHKKKKVESKHEITPETLEGNLSTEKQILIPDMNCFTDKNYCFRKNELNYTCRLCVFTGSDIVHHYKNEHPHVEIPLSRMAPYAAREAIEQCKEINFQAVSKIASDKYVCIFCYKEFVNNNSVLETFFWHVVSMHTGEYKHNCSECMYENRCPFSLDIPPPPKHTKGQLIGYICKKCNFTQLSLENLKTHVIVRHNDEQTAVYTINLAAMSKKALREFLRRCEVPILPVLPASTSQEIAAKMPSPDRSIAENCTRVCESEATVVQPPKKTNPLTSIQSKITFEADDNNSELSDMTSEGSSESTVKIERVDPDTTDEILHEEPQSTDVSEIDRPSELEHLHPSQPLCQQEPQPSPTARVEELVSEPSNDIVDYPHFKVYITESGAKEYICCINGKDNHFKTTLLISMKKHVQLKHSENWDGYCFVCKVIVTPQGAHRFKDCFQHYLDKHMDNFPILQKDVITESTPEKIPDKNMAIENSASKSYIHVRNISELISTTDVSTLKENPSFPIIQSVVSLGAQSIEAPRPSPTYPTMRREEKTSEVAFRYEEVQAEVMLKKHRVVLETMMARDKLVKVYKCAGRFCSFTSDSAEDALLHASTHQRIGGIDALKCSYCDFDAMGNAIDLVMHVFKTHGHCQYSCAQCFYRAAASQSVGAHMSRVHGIAQSCGTVLRTTTVTTNTVAEATMLTREQAVPYYVCSHAEREGTCKFRTYTPDKFCEHLQQKHAAATSHSCYMCDVESQSAPDLVQHMKSHGLKLYQCTWCVLGADNEAQLLAHVSSVHPGRQPQAYLRIITNKEGSNELRVLPLAFLNKLKVPTEDVTPSSTKENPVREAERSIDLEKLIGLTMIGEPIDEPSGRSPVTTDPPQTLLTTLSVESITNVERSKQLDTAVVAPGVRLDTITDSRETVVENVVAKLPFAEPSVASTSVEPPQVTQTLPVKAEPLETPKMNLGEIVVIDSDEEDADPQPEYEPELEPEPEREPEPELELVLGPEPFPEQPALKQPVIELSDDDPATNIKKNYKNKKVPPEILPTCPKCRQICKSISGLKKHLHYCYPNKGQGCVCPHCEFQASNRDIIMQHYMNDHCDKNIYQCGVCRVNLMSLATVKKHVKYVHKEKDITVSQTMENGIYCFLVNVARKEKKELPKRKLSATTSNETMSQRRFLPQDIDKLPINPILDHLVYCDVCEFSTKVRLNMVRHLQFHAEQQPVPQTAPVNPVPHLETNEKHFDKMVNLASSSIVNRPEKQLRFDYVPYVPIIMEPELAARYPRQITTRERNTCGASGCAYISVDETMLKRHWETLHTGTTRFRCMHCPHSQSVDCSKPITASRVAAHLKMHDETLYACSKCNFYHFRRDFVERHLIEMHPDGDLMVVRENPNSAAAAPLVPTSTAPTMDLKPWQCGFCKFKSMLRPEVADHCFKFHQSKMQFRCAYCPYRASAVENVNNHLAHSHADEPEEVIFYYYREGSLPDDEDGTPRWVKQRQKMGSAVPEVKTETERSPVESPVPSLVNVDLNLVKKEVVDEASPGAVESIEELCNRLGEFCEPNGIKFRCPLCKVVMEDTREGMQSHLYEELKYRKWGCGLCSYKAFHKAGLIDHMTSEHRRQYDHIELPTDINIEKWVTGQLDHQAAIIEQHKANLAKQKITIERNKPELSTNAPPTIEAVEKFSVAQLEEAFGVFGAPNNMMFCCPKCGTLNKDEAAMKDHLEMELNKIRWGCSNCSEKYQTYHEAQFHCKGHDGPSRPKEAIRDPSMRAAWVSNIIQTQKNLMQRAPVTPTSSEPPTSEKNVLENDNSLLVVRYEQRVPTPDLVTMTRKRSAPDSDDERLIIDEPGPKRRAFQAMKQCTYCTFKNKNHNIWREHVLKHFSLKPYTCCYCDFSSSRQNVLNHTVRFHPKEPQRMKLTQIPTSTPATNLSTVKQHDDETIKLICLFCEKTVPETELDTHLHENIRPDFAKKGDVVVKCCICLALRLDVKSLQDHHNLAHPNMAINYALFKLHHEHRDTHYCGYCQNIGFKFMRDLKTHHNAVHSALQFKYTSIPYLIQGKSEEIRKKEDFPPQTLVRRCARKSTTKLPGCKAVAKKSTTKLPYTVPSTSDEGYSYYKTHPEPLEHYANVTTLMSFCNRMMPFTLKKLSEIINIEPKVLVTDAKPNPSDTPVLNCE